MRAYVTLQQPRPGEALAAIMALASLIVGPHVHAERGHADVDLVAVRAPSGLLIAQRPVRLPVPGQIRRRRVPLAAVGALVILVLGVRLRLRGGRSSRRDLARRAGRRRYRRGIAAETGNDRHLPGETRQSLLRAGGETPRRETNSQGGAPLGTAVQALPLDLDPLEEVPRPFAQCLVLPVLICHLDHDGP